MPDIGPFFSGAMAIVVGSCCAIVEQAEPDAARIVTQDISFYQGVSTAFPEVDGIFAQPEGTPEPCNFVIPDYPVPGLVRIYATGVASASRAVDFFPPLIGELNAGTGDCAAIDIP